MPKASKGPTVGKQCVIAEVSSSQVTTEISQRHFEVGYNKGS